MPIKQPTPPTDDGEPVTVDAALQKERDWRLQVYLEMGLEREDAEHLSMRPDVDWHLVRRLLNRGCDVETAIRIVA